MRKPYWRYRQSLCALALCALACMASASAPLGVEPRHLDPAFWIAALDAPDRPYLDAAAIDALNTAMRRDDPSFHRLAEFAPTLSGQEVRKRIVAISTALPPNRFDERGRELGGSVRRALQKMLALDRIGAEVTPAFGLVLRRAALRSYPTSLRVFNRSGDLDIDRFQESALFPGDAVAVLHRSSDRRWWFVVSERYAAWIEAADVAIGARTSVLAYAGRRPALTVLGNVAHTVHTREAPALSRLALDMGVRLPLRSDWPADVAVNGQLPIAAWIVDVPARAAGGALVIAPALVARGEPVAPDALPFTPANTLRQAFRFLGERYGWGHDYQARDCSGFVSEVYRSFGIALPRNTGDQSGSPVLDRIVMAAGVDPLQRERALASVQAGDLIYVPGHVMMAIGRIDGGLWVIHDVNGVNVLDRDGSSRRLPLNGVSVTPLAPLMADPATPLSAHITAIARIRLGATR